MRNEFDCYDDSYRTVVQDSINFSGLEHAFFLKAKVRLLSRWMAGRFPGGKPARALDVGCGVGALHGDISELVGELHGVDPSAACIARAEEEHPSLQYRIGDGTALPYPNATFDLVTAVCAVHHVPPNQRPQFLEETRRVTIPGGYVCIIEHNPFNPLTRLAISRCPFDDDAVLVSARKLRALMEKCGFRDVGSRHFLLLPSGSPVAVRIENALSAMPFGAQYMAFGRA